MGMRYRRSVKAGPFRLNFGKGGFTSASIKAGNYTHNLKSGKSTVNLPGGLSYQTGGKPAPARPSANKPTETVTRMTEEEFQAALQKAFNDGWYAAYANMNGRPCDQHHDLGMSN